MEKQETPIPQSSVDEWWERFLNDMRAEERFVGIIAGLCLLGMMIVGLSKLL